MRKSFAAVAGVLIVAGWAGAAAAHHSTANYDNRRVTDVKGVIKELDPENPHTRLTIVVGAQTMEFEGQSVQNLYRLGYRRGMLMPGTPVTVNYSPLKQGSDGYAGLFWAVTLPDGKVVGQRREPPPPGSVG